MRILVTGINGFTGSHLKPELEAHGHTVKGLYSNLTEPEAISTEIAKLKPEAVVHLAGISYVGHGNVREFYEVNLIGTQNLLEALDKHAPDVRSILLTSSGNIYGNQVEDDLSEEIIPCPTNDYAVSKLAMEKMAQLWVDRLPLFIVRPFNYTGIGQKQQFLVPKIIAHFRKQKSTIELGCLDVWREFGDVRTVVDIYRRLVELCPLGNTLNVCTGQTHSLREVISLCEKITGHSIKIQINADFVRSNEVILLRGSNDRLKKIIKEWKSFSLEETLTWMLGNEESRLA
ncbi:MAG: NAD-dependent epimerase/dehydratase family protein [Nitrospinia bacterium]